ncbi:hypothetical protein [Nocardioides sp. zg-DK7169]|uniref:DUF3592 domain-containing protein n=1 Tax=Nocardioides sp. zg-DK7169 TaxID=2736600 RepID=UPI0015576CE4|nr:hypothetical protein [Nocardioides sp. zg-DK7169]NPC97895.1 hypothetical protein [Nocardioides sp. zg-DK7169]
MGIVLGGAFAAWGIHGYATAPRPDRTVTGQVVDSPCSRVIEYVVEGKTYRLDLGRRRCRAAHPGQPIEVSYESAHPERAFAQGDARWVELGTGVLGLLVAGGTPLLAYRHRRRQRLACAP